MRVCVFKICVFTVCMSGALVAVGAFRLLDGCDPPLYGHQCCAALLRQGVYAPNTIAHSATHYREKKITDLESRNAQLKQQLWLAEAEAETLRYDSTLQCTVLRCTILCYTVLYCTALYCTLPYCTPETLELTEWLIEQQTLRLR